MRAEELIHVRKAIRRDQEYYEMFRGFCVDYMWLEGYWGQCSERGGIDRFCQRFGEYYWDLKELKRRAWELAKQGCVGNSKCGYEPTDEVIKATMFLVHRCGLGDHSGAASDCRAMVCYRTRRGLDLCNAEQQADKWPTPAGSGFRATMYIVRQIRHNLFHGRKTELEPEQFKRNRELITAAQHITSLVIDALVDAEDTLAG